MSSVGLQLKGPLITNIAVSGVGGLALNLEWSVPLECVESHCLET